MYTIKELNQMLEKTKQELENRKKSIKIFQKNKDLKLKIHGKKIYNEILEVLKSNKNITEKQLLAIKQELGGL